MWWAGNDCFYAGRVTQINEKTQKHEVHYDDGDVRWESLLGNKTERWMLEPSPISMPEELARELADAQRAAADAERGRLAAIDLGQRQELQVIPIPATNPHPCHTAAD